MIYFIIGLTAYLIEPLISVIKMPYCIFKYALAFFMFPFFRRSVRKKTVQIAYDMDVERAMNWRRSKPATVRELYKWL